MWMNTGRALSRVLVTLAFLIAQGCAETPFVDRAGPSDASTTPATPPTQPSRPRNELTIGAASPITRIGGIQHLTVQLRKQQLDPLQIDWSSLDPDSATVDGFGMVTAVGMGSARIVAIFGTLRDTALISVAPVVAHIERTIDTLVLPIDSLRPLPFVVRDSGGAVLPPAAITMRSSGSAAVELARGGSLLGVLPGRGSLVVSAGELTDSVPLSVRGVVVLADGQRVTSPGSLLGATEIEVRNGRVRLKWDPSLGLRAGFGMSVWVNGAWIQATVNGAADWLYIANNVITEPTSIDLLTVSDSVVALRMRMGNHWFLPQSVGYPLSYVDEPHPFSRTIWLRRGEWGYYSWIDLEEPLNYTGIEHEIGFGGLWGPGRVRTAEVDFRTESMQAHNRYNLDWGPDAVEFVRDGDPLRRVIVPLPGAPMITPVFPGWGYGSVYVHRNDDKSYGAYLFAAPESYVLATREICQRAWREAPFPLPSISDAELAACGPN